MAIALEYTYTNNPKLMIFQNELIRSLEAHGDKIAIEHAGKKLSYSQLYGMSKKVTSLLLELNLEKETLIGIKLNDRIDIISSIIGVLNARCVFVLLDSDLPRQRLKAMISDMNLQYVISARDISSEATDEISHQLFMEDILVRKDSAGTLRLPGFDGNDSIYIYFTSGSTGTPKAVVGRNRSLLQFLRWEIQEFGVDKTSRFSQLTSPYFDAFLRDVFTPLLAGGTICIPPDEIIVSWIDEARINFIHCVPSLFRVINNDSLAAENFSCLRYVLMSGEKINPLELVNWYKIFDTRIQLVNLYGATETTMIRACYQITPEDAQQVRIPIGFPISDTELLILNKDLNQCDTLIAGDLYIASEFISKGYFNAPELTRKKFLKLNEGTPREKTAYRTGDKARKLANGKIELLGREDRQIKLRGIRIELDEIEGTMVRSGLVKNAAVIVHADENENETLVAFVLTGDDSRKGPALKEQLVQYLGDHLPAYMIPSDIVQVNEFPLLTNGKINYKGLVGLLVSEKEIVLPITETETKILLIWKEILGEKEISTEENFNKAGGNSLSMINLISKINKEFNVKFPLSQLFENLTVRKQARFVEEAGKETTVIVIPQAPAREHYALSSTQKRLYFLYEFDRESLAYNMPQVIKLEGKVDRVRLNVAFNKLVTRHEVLRTSIEVVNEEPVQSIITDFVFDITYFHASEEEVPSIIKEFIQPFDLNAPPLMRAGLIQIASEEHILMVDMHHIVADGVSQNILVKDFMALYDGEELPALKLQYKDFAEWQQKDEQQKRIATQREFWINEFADKPEVLTLPTDFPRPPVRSYEGSTLNFSIEAEQTKMLRALAESEGGTMSMVVLSIYNVLLAKISNKEDITLGIPIAGRQHSDLNNVIGMFVNTLPLRSYPKGDLTFRKFLASLRSKMLVCLSNQDFPYEELIDILNIERDTSRNPLFDVMLAYQNFEMTQLEIPNLRLKPYKWQKMDVKFDITVFVTEDGDKIDFRVEFLTSLFKQETIERFIWYFKRIVTSVVENPEVELRDIDVVDEAEKQMLLHDFNPVSAPERQGTIVSLFEDQVRKTPEKNAIYYEGEQLTFSELNARSNQLAHYLRKEYQIKPNGRVAIMAERSDKMVIALLASLKSGAAYVPVGAAQASRDRTRYIVQDCGASVLLTDKELAEGVGQGDVPVVNLNNRNSFDIDIHDPVNINGPDDLCYIIYPPGASDKPGGIMISHGNVLNLFAGLSRLPHDNESCMLATTDLSFDRSVLELIWTLCHGVEVVLHSQHASLSNFDRYASGRTMPVDFSLFFFSSYNNHERDKYDLLLDSVKYADQNGFKAVWTPERHFHEFGGLYPNPSVMSAALAMVTSKIELRCGSIVSPLHDSIRIAEEWSLVDNLSNGRIALSFGSGWNVNDFVLAEDIYDVRQKVMHQQISDVKKLWQGKPLKRKNGQKKEIEVNIFPRPIQKELPVWITSSKSIDTFISAGAIGANVLTHLLGQDLQELEVKIKAYREERLKNGHHPEDGKVTVMLHTFIGDDIDEVEKIVQQPFTEYLKSAIGLDKIMMEEAGLKEEEVSEEDRRTILKSAFTRYYKTASLIGTRSSCSEMVRSLSGLGVDEIACLVDFGIAKDTMMKGLENLNALKDLFVQEKNRHHQPVTMMQGDLSLMSSLASDPGSRHFLGSLRALLMGSEMLSFSTIGKLRRDYPQMAIYNLYGASEATVGSTLYSTGEIAERISAGRPMYGTQLYMLNEDLKLLPAGVAGDLYIGGAGVSRGYWNKPELTAARFVDSPFLEGSKIFRTNDIARWLPDGNLDYIGRKDRRIRLQGCEIVPEEIEDHLRSLEGIGEAIVVLVEREDRKYLAAYYVSETELSEAALHDSLQNRLPAHMVPSRYVWLSAIPRAAGGKLDRKSLPDPEIKVEHHYQASGDEIEEKLVDIWSKVLKMDRERISLNTSFFKMGGHSLRAVVLVNKIFKELGVKVPLKLLFEHNSILSLKRFIQAAKVSNYSDIRVVPRKSHYAMSDAQVAMYYLYEFDRSSLFYNQPRIMKVEGALSTDKLHSAFHKLITRHEVLRTSIEIVNDEPMQKINDQFDFAIEYYHVPEDQVRTCIEKIIRPFDLQKAPLIRVGLVDVSPGVHYLVIDTHHIAVDGTADSVLIREIAALYKEEKLPELKLQYKDYSEWQQSDGRLRQIEKQKEFWINQFSDEIPVLELPADFADPVPEDQHGGSTDIVLSSEDQDKLNAIAEREGASMFMVMLSVYNILLSKLANQEDVLIGTLVSGREHDDVESMLGMFVSALPLRNYPRGESTFVEFLRTVKTSTLASFENQAYLYKSPLHELNIERGASHKAPYRAFFIFQNFEKSADIEIPGLTFRSHFAGGIGESRYDMNLVALLDNNRLNMHLDCSRQFRKETRERFVKYFELIVKSIIADSDMPISSIQIITDEERSHILDVFNGNRKPVNQNKVFAQLLKAQVNKTPNRPAVEHNGKVLTYQELYGRSVQLASYLQEMGASPGRRIAVYMPRTSNMLISILAILHSGCTYVPIDVDYPYERVKQILNDSGSEIILMSQEVNEALEEELRFSIPSLKALANLDQLDLTGHDLEERPPRHNIHDLAYIIYTSGTTGKPKGVMIHQLGMINHLMAKINDLKLGKNDVIAQTASPCFDISVWQFLAALLVGGKTHIIDNEEILEPGRLVGTLQAEKITVFESVPSLMTTFLDGLPARQDTMLADLRWMIATGEPLSVGLAEKWYSIFSEIRLLNAYGPTEASDDITHHVVALPDAGQRTIPIGRPIQNMQIYILDKYLNLCPVGVKGEICVAGLGVGGGYWKNEEQTKKVFIDNPFVSHIKDPGYATLYKTGDTGYYLANGAIMCLGRIDEQVKIRGFRIEPAEIENVLIASPNIKEAVVLTDNAGKGHKKLVAFIVPVNQSERTQDVKKFLKGKLPNYMIPSDIVKIDKMPLTNNGKVDKKALLHKFSVLEHVKENHIEPKTDVEIALVRIWEELLGIEQIGTNDDFFELGGHSLSAMRLAAAVKRQLNVDIPIRTLFELSTIALIAQWIELNRTAIVDLSENTEEIRI